MAAAIYVLRHGQTEWNRDRRVQGSSESRLTARGRSQARAQGRIVAPLLNAHPAIALYASPLIRTRQTAELALGTAAARVVYDARIQEVHMGAWEGHLKADLESRYPVLAEADTPVFHQCLSAPGGEGFDDLRTRVQDFVDELPDRAVVVTHGVSGAMLRGMLLRLDIDGIAALGHEQGCVYRIENGRETILTEPVTQA